MSQYAWKSESCSCALPGPSWPKGSSQNDLYYARWTIPYPSMTALQSNKYSRSGADPNPPTITSFLLTMLLRIQLPFIWNGVHHAHRLYLNLLRAVNIYCSKPQASTTPSGFLSDSLLSLPVYNRSRRSWDLGKSHIPLFNYGPTLHLEATAFGLWRFYMQTWALNIPHCSVLIQVTTWRSGLRQFQVFSFLLSVLLSPVRVGARVYMSHTSYVISSKLLCKMLLNPFPVLCR